MVWRFVKLLLWVIPPVLILLAVAMVLWFRKDVMQHDNKVAGEISDLRKAPVEKYDFGLDKFDQAVALLESGQNDDARRALLGMLRAHRDSARAYDAMRLLGQMNMDRLFDSTVASPGKKRVEVNRGDSINKLAADNQCTFQYIVRANNLAKPDAIQPHDQLWVCPLNFSVIVRAAEKRLIVMDGDLFFTVFPVMEIRKSPGAKLPMKGSVGQKFGVAGGKRLQPGDDDMVAAEKWIEIGGDWAIRSVKAGAQPPAGFGIFLAEADADDLFAILRKGNRVELNP